jgi:hypothetical protein
MRLRILPFSQKDVESDPELDPDPLVRGTDPRIRIRIPNTAFEPA